MLKKIGNISLFLLCVSFTFTQTISIKAYVDRNQVKLGNNIAYTIEIAGLNQFNINLPTLANFTLLNPNPATSSSVNIANGRMTQTVSYTYYLRPEKVGKLAIPQMNIKIKGKNYSINAVVINVQKSNLKTTGKNIMLKTVISSSNPFVNEEVTVRTILYVKNGFTLKQVNLSKVPGISGAWKESYELKNIQTLDPKTINGVSYNSYLLTKEALFPTKSGKLSIESAEMLVSFINPRNRNNARQLDLFGNFFGQSGNLEKITVTAQKRNLTVKATPPTNKSGFVGNLTITTKFDKNTFKTNEGFKLTITMRGTGNIQTLKETKFYISPDIEQYEPSVRTSIDRKGQKISGRKTIEYVLVPRVAGKQKIGPIEYSYFNTRKKKVETITIAEFILDVKEGKSFNAVSNGGTDGTSKKRLKKLGEDIRYIKINSDDFQKINKHLGKSFTYFLIYFLVLILFFILNLVMKRRIELNHNIALKRKKTASSKATKQLKEATAYYNEKNISEFFPSVYLAVMQFIADQTGTDSAGFTSEQIRELLERSQIQSELSERILALGENCDFYRYSNPSDPDSEMSEILKEAESILNDLIKAFKK